MNFFENRYMENLVRRSEKRDSGFEKNIFDRLFVIDITKKYFYQLPILILHVKINTNTGHRKDKKPWKKHMQKYKNKFTITTSTYIPKGN